jgi:TetR/AcrR family transcriptional regulator, cholesterol catabolism regulator
VRRRDDNRSARDAIIGVTLELLRDRGYDGLRVDEVAKQARVSLSTVYKEFPSRDELVIGAVAHWMATRVYRPFTAPGPDEPWHVALAATFRSIFEPLVGDPTMLAVYVRARSLPGGPRLIEEGAESLQPRLRAAFGDEDPEFADDVFAILEDVVYASLGRFGDGLIEAAEIIPRLERAIAVIAGRVPAAPAPRRGTR